MEDFYKKYEPIFGAWYIKKLLGEGSFGKVYEIERNEFNNTYQAALKTITIPKNNSEVKSIMADGLDEKGVTQYFENLVEELINEFVLMSKLKGNSNIVSYEDHAVIKHKEGFGWDILVRMELLTGLVDFINNNIITRKDVIKLGIDICKALELCQKYNIIHRDIKPENIFVSENGDFKLGDFGIARQIEKTSSGLSKKGTYTYMAPEVYLGEAYGSNVDIYSLGIVMYRLLNQNRAPFLPAYPSPITFNNREEALMKCISGEKMPPPINADGRLAEIVLKACNHNPKDRYSSPMQMREELEAILYNKEEAKVIYPNGDQVEIKSLNYLDDRNDSETHVINKDSMVEDTIFIEETELISTDTKIINTLGAAKKKNKIILIVAVLICISVASIYRLSINKEEKVSVIGISGINKKLDLRLGEEYKLHPNIMPVNSTDKAIIYSSSNSDVVEVDGLGKVITKKIGSAEVKLKADQFETTIKVYVKPGEIKNSEKIVFTVPPKEIIRATISPIIKATIIPKVISKISVKENNNINKEKKELKTKSITKSTPKPIKKVIPVENKENQNTNESNAPDIVTDFD